MTEPQPLYCRLKEPERVSIFLHQKPTKVSMLHGPGENKVARWFLFIGPAQPSTAHGSYFLLSNRNKKELHRSRTCFFMKKKVAEFCCTRENLTPSVRKKSISPHPTIFPELQNRVTTSLNF